MAVKQRGSENKNMKECSKPEDVPVIVRETQGVEVVPRSVRDTQGVDGVPGRVRESLRDLSSVRIRQRESGSIEETGRQEQYHRRPESSGLGNGREEK